MDVCVCDCTKRWPSQLLLTHLKVEYQTQKLQPDNVMCEQNDHLTHLTHKPIQEA